MCVYLYIHVYMSYMQICSRCVCVCVPNLFEKLPIIIIYCSPPVLLPKNLNVKNGKRQGFVLFFFPLAWWRVHLYRNVFVYLFIFLFFSPPLLRTSRGGPPLLDCWGWNVTINSTLLAICIYLNVMMIGVTGIYTVLNVQKRKRPNKIKGQK